MGKRPTVIDVARLANVGPSTVSRFLRGVKTGEVLGRRIEEAIRSTGYHPDENARALRVGKSRSIGVILPKVSNAFFGNFVQILEARARDAGYTMLLLAHEDHPDEMAKQLSTLRRCRVDGALITGCAGTTLAAVREVVGDLPVVAFDALLAPEGDAVVLQNREAAAMATEHLIAHGHRKLAVVTAKPETYSFQERIQGFNKAMTHAGLKPQSIVAGDYDELRHMLRNTIKGPGRPDAMLTLSDFSTLNVVRIFDEARLKADQWIPMIGFDDFDYAPLLAVPITVVKQPIEELTRSALALLLKRIEGTAPETAQLIQVPGELVRRRSCGCA